MSNHINAQSYIFKGLAEAADGGAKLISRDISDALNIEVNVLMGANLANEVAEDKFCESTVGKYVGCQFDERPVTKCIAIRLFTGNAIF